jgi:sugar phosphate isomerase/epimerase
MTSWPIGLSTGCFYHQNILDLKSVQRAAEHFKDLGMEAYSFHAPFAPNIDIASSDSGQRADSVAEIFKAAEAAALLRVHYFVLHPGPENPAAIPAEEQLPRMQHVVDSLNHVARHCRELGIMCVLENKLPHLLFGNTSDILWILDGTNTAEVGACLDTGHAFLAGDMHNLVHKLSGHLRMIHAHDNAGADDNHLPPGDGKIDWEEFLRDLIEAGFRGAFILEMAGNDDPAVTMINARRGRSYLREISRRLALGHVAMGA